MSQHDYDVANAAFATVRADINSALAAIVSQNSGAAQPATMFSYQFWADTTTGLLKQRNAANTGWITIGTLATTNLGLALVTGVNTQAFLIANATAIDHAIRADQIQKQSVVAFTTAGTSIAFTLTPTPALAGLVAGTKFHIKFNATAGATPTLAVSGLAATALKVYDSSGIKAAASATSIVANMQSDVLYDGTDWVVLDALPMIDIPRNYLSGCTMSTAGTSTTLSVSAGQAADSTNAIVLNVAALAKTTSAWAVGTAAGGKLSVAAIAASTWYYFYAIRRPDTGVVDVGFDVSSSAPTLPTSYTQYRYIGAAKTDGASNWTAFTQTGRKFMWGTPILDVNAVATSVTASTVALSVPLGRKMEAVFNATGGGGGNVLYLSDLANADLTPSVSVAPLGGTTGYSTTTGTNGYAPVFTNTSAQIRARSSAASGNWSLATLGWTDLADTQ